MRTPAAIALALAALLMAGCRKSVPRGTSVQVASEEQEDLGLAELRSTLESTVLENYDQLNNGNWEALADAVVADHEPHLIGVSPEDLVLSRKELRERGRKQLFRMRNPRVLSKNLDVRLSEDGSVGWVYDETSLRVDVEGRVASIPIRLTAVFVRDVDRWVVASEHLSYGYPVEAITLLATRGSLVELPRFKTNYGGSREAAAPLIGLSGLFVNAGGIDSLAPQNLILLPGPEHEFQDATPPSLAKLFGARATVAVKSFRIEMAESGRVAWMVASLAIQTRHNGDSIRIPLRATFVFQRPREGEWRIVQSHISAGLGETQLSEWVFGPE